MMSMAVLWWLCVLTAVWGTTGKHRSLHKQSTTHSWANHDEDSTEEVEKFLMRAGRSLLTKKTSCMVIDERRTVPCLGICQCVPEQDAVICRNRNLSTLPKGISSTTRALDLSRNIFRSLYNTTFIALPQLELLYLNFNNITTIERRTFSHLTKLCSLNLSRNKLTAYGLEHSVYCGIPQSSLKMLNVSKSERSYRTQSQLSPHAMECLRNSSIEMLDLSYDRPLCHMKNGTFAGMNSLTTPYFTLMECSTFNTFALENAPNIEELHLSRNELNEMPIFTTGEKINGTPFYTPLLPKLTKLVLDHNKISFFSMKVARGLQNVKSLVLANNDIKFIGSKVLKYWKSLEVLILNNNRIKKIYGYGLQSPTLQVISLYNNPFILNSIYMFRNSPEIRAIHIGQQNGFYPEAVAVMFQNLSKLNSLSLDFLQGFKDISEHMFTGLTSLTTLSLQRNLINNVDYSLFKDLKSLKYIYMNNNNLDYINVTSFPRCWKKNLLEIDLHSNPWDCSCDLLWFIDWIQDKNSNLINREKYVCSFPPERQRKKLINLRLTADMCLKKPLSKFLISAMIFSGFITLVILVLSGIYRWRWHLRRRMFYFKLWRLPSQHHVEGTSNDSYHFDAYISYNKVDLPWVKNALLRELEDCSELQFRLCLSDRNFLVGHDKVDCIDESISISRKVVLIVTNKFAKCQWCQLELTMAQHNLFEKDNDNVILAIMEDIDELNMTPRLALEIRRKPYLSWTNDKTGQQLFWEKLRHMVKSPNTSVRLNRPSPEEIDTI